MIKEINTITLEYMKHRIQEELLEILDKENKGE